MTCQWSCYFDDMKNIKTGRQKVNSKPVKVLLHMACVDDDWAGKAILINKKEEYRFKSLKELAGWLIEQIKFKL